MGVYSPGAMGVAPWTVTVRGPDLIEYDGQLDGYTSVVVDLSDPSVEGDAGTWELTLPSTHRAIPALVAEGAGVVFRPAARAEVIASGDWETYTETTENGQRFHTFSGNVDDDRLHDELAWVDPAHDLNDATGQNPVPGAADVRTGPAETVFKAFVTANVRSTGTAVQTARQWPWLHVPVTAGLGTTISLKGQFDSLFTLGQQAASPTTGITWALRQQSSGVLRLVVRQRVDQSANVVFSHAEGTLGKSTLTRRRPTVTQALASSGGDTTRVFARVTDSPAETLWVRRRVVMVDGSTDVIADLTTAAAEAITAGREKAGLTAEPVPLSTGPRLGIDYQLGDYVSAVTSTGARIRDLLTQVSYRHDADTPPTITPAIGVNRVDESDALVPIVRNLVRHARRTQARS